MGQDRRVVPPPASTAEGGDWLAERRLLLHCAPGPLRQGKRKGGGTFFRMTKLEFQK